MKIAASLAAKFFVASGMLAAALQAQAPATAAPPVLPHDTLSIASRAVGERRIINVYTPPGYARNSRARYAVVYMPDGGIAEDFPHVVKTLDSLIARGRIAPVIVVGIENTERRRDMTGPTTVHSDSAIAAHVGGSAPFRRFIGDELMPEIRRRYRTTDETTIVGESLAGLFIVETFVQQPAMFQRYIALSPSLWWNRDQLVRDSAALSRSAPGVRTLFLSAANEDGIATQTATFAATLRARPNLQLTLMYEPRPDLEHRTIYNAMAPGAFVKVLSQKPVNRGMDEQAVRAARAQSNAAIARHDVPGIMAFVDEAFIINTGNGGQLRSAKEMAAAFTRQFAELHDVVYVRTPKTVEASASNPLAFESGTWVGTWTAPAGPVRTGGKYSASWHLVDGAWKIHAELFVTLYCEGKGCA